MRDQMELSAAIKRAMREKKLAPEELGKRLNVSTIMLNKIMCGEVVPSRHLEKQMIETLGIEPERVKSLAARRQKRSSAAKKRDSQKRKAA